MGGKKKFTLGLNIITKIFIAKFFISYKVKIYDFNSIGNFIASHNIFIFLSKFASKLVLLAKLFKKKKKLFRNGFIGFVSFFLFWGGW